MKVGDGFHRDLEMKVYIDGKINPTVEFFRDNGLERRKWIVSMIRTWRYSNCKYIERYGDLIIIERCMGEGPPARGRNCCLGTRIILGKIAMCDPAARIVS
jgi:hypothetical protein